LMGCHGFEFEWTVGFAVGFVELWLISGLLWVMVGRVTGWLR